MIKRQTWSTWTVAIALMLAGTSARAVNLYLRSGSSFCIYGGTSGQSLQTISGTSLASLPFSAKTNTFSFYSTVLTNSVSIGSNKKVGGTFYVQNNGTTNFQLQIKEAIYDYNPTTGIATQIATYPTSAWSSSISSNGATGQIILPQKKLGSSCFIPAGHMLRVDVTVILNVDSNINGALIYNTSSGNGKSSIEFPNNGIVWPFGKSSSVPDATITASSYVARNSTGNLASVVDAGMTASYSWTITNGIITAGQSTRQITWTAGSAGHVGLGVIVMNVCYSSQSNLVIDINSKNNQTISFNSIPDQTYGNPSIALNAAASSGLPVTFNVVSGSVAISNNVLTITGAGDVVVNANQAGDANWNPAVAQQSFIINPKSLTVSGITATDKVYDGNTATTVDASATSASGVIAGDSVSLDTSTVTGDFADADIGNAKLVVISGLGISGTVTGNYVLPDMISTTANIIPASLIITANSTNKPHGQTMSFTGTEFSSTGLADGDSVDSVTLNSTGGPAAATNGTYNIVPSKAKGIGLSNYTITYVNGTLIVGSWPRPTLTILPQSDGSIRVSVSGGLSGQTYVLQLSTNLSSWTSMSTNTAGTNGATAFVDMDATNYVRRFYRMATP